MATRKRPRTAESPEAPAVVEGDNSTADAAHSDDGFEDTYVVLDVPADLANAKTLAALGPDAFDLERFGTASPTVTIGGKTLKGSYAPLVASQLIFEQPSGKEQWKLAAVSNKRIAVASPEGKGGRRATKTLSDQDVNYIRKASAEIDDGDE
jgi:hypothetical protein